LEQIDAAAESGFDAVGLRIFPVMDTDIDVMADTALRRSIQRRIQESGLGVFDVEVVRITPETDTAALLPALDFAGSLGAQWLAVTSAARDEYCPEEESALARRLSDLADVAARRNMGVMLEFMAYRGIATVRDAARIVESVGHPRLGITIDALHFFRSGGTTDDLANIAPEHLACVQLCDAPEQPPESLPREARYGRAFPGEGGLPLMSLLSALPEELPVCVEVPSESHSTLSVRDRAAKAELLTRRLLATDSPKVH
jgi:sugar phosphate isomerase/epimerase